MDTTLAPPRVTVLMPVYNGARYLRDAMDSILAQTYADFEFLIVDDGSTDESVEIIRSYTDPRIRLERNGMNRGLVYSLNRGISLARGGYVARMDCDDISLPQRLAEQVAYLDKHRDIAVCGTWVKTLGERAAAYEYFLDPEDIKASLLFTTSLAHPTVMLRKSLLKEAGLEYDPAHAHAEDYGLWVSLVHAGYKLANLPLVSLLYRRHVASVSAAHSKAQKETASGIRNAQLAWLGIDASAEHMEIHNGIKGGENFVRDAEAWLTTILNANKTSRVYSQLSLGRVVYRRWRTICGANAGSGLMTWRMFIRSPLSHLAGRRERYLDSAKFFIKGLLARPG
ncbi:MAG TPA: glycosyltransferase family A protein [Candidatus Paceibacterota bacterium]|nr:glycosyltransferase family A protein [Candidatus Paceibacterota bacterium]